MLSRVTCLICCSVIRWISGKIRCLRICLFGHHMTWQASLTREVCLRIAGFKHVPEVFKTLGREWHTHTLGYTDFNAFKGKDVTVVGSGQSAVPGKPQRSCMNRDRRWFNFTNRFSDICTKYGFCVKVIPPQNEKSSHSRGFLVFPDLLILLWHILLHNLRYYAILDRQMIRIIF
ncbi:SidA/IucD/PvdA family monooxygenase [Paenibacillus aurantiacus]|uniref:L-lysine N6-monooxygenase MbtG n=1 Tax=Paenibacillus aurantiacus TaxID=1936118 RepID=A0ABV5KTV4_9BACL